MIEADIENSILGEGSVVQPGAVVGFRYHDSAGAAELGANAVIRMGTIIYGDVRAGKGFATGHNVLVREFTTIGDHVMIGTNTVIDGQVEIGDFVKIESNCYISTHVRIGTRVFIGPGTTLTNDRIPLKKRDEYAPLGPVLEDGVTLGGGVVLLPGVVIGEGSFVAAGAVVIRNVPPMSLVKGVPGKISDLPEELRERNMALNWRHLIDG